jgi:hypothetical protein
MPRVKNKTPQRLPSAAHDDSSSDSADEQPGPAQAPTQLTSGAELACPLCASYTTTSKLRFDCHLQDCTGPVSVAARLPPASVAPPPRRGRVVFAGPPPGCAPASWYSPAVAPRGVAALRHEKYCGHCQEVCASKPTPFLCTRCPAAFCGECFKPSRDACPSCLLLEARGVDSLRCDFCNREGLVETHNRLLIALKPQHPDKAIVTHLLCEKWSSGIAAAAAPREERQQLLWVEANRGRRLKCAICGLSGATTGCMVASCKLSYHVQCAMGASGVTFFEQTLCLACPKHGGKQLGAGLLTLKPAPPPPPPPPRAGQRRTREE